MLKIEAKNNCGETEASARVNLRWFCGSYIDFDVIVVGILKDAMGYTDRWMVGELHG